MVAPRCYAAASNPSLRSGSRSLTLALPVAPSADCVQLYPTPRLSSPGSRSDSECEGVRSASVRTTQAVADSWKLKDGNGVFKTIWIEEPGSPSLAPHLPMRRSPGMTEEFEANRKQPTL